ncbi:MAG: PLP-dependent transferase [Clostridia bacterium]|nr:PLP-dependent transferase [Clostridia bacterium]
MKKTPIADFLDDYAKKNAARFHMPGHKGRGDAERYDITEIDGAGDLFSDSGIISESEEVASEIFGCPTYYSTEGSSLAIRTMAALAARGGTKRVIAGRNAHRAFISAAILLDLDVEWLFPRGESSYLSCPITPSDVAVAIDSSPERPCFVYVTSPDYLGNTVDIEGIARVCHERGVLLLVDNAHGAYLKFLSPSRHPIDLGADMCADSAHKTLPVLTGGAYLHLSPAAAELYRASVKETMSLFASSSPSYLIMRSLDMANPVLDALSDTLPLIVEAVREVKGALSSHGYALVGDEELKITIRTKPFGYTGDDMARLVSERGVIPEFHDPDFISFMISQGNTEDDLRHLLSTLSGIEKKDPVEGDAPHVMRRHRVMSPREAYFSTYDDVPTSECVGRVLSSCSVSCPPAVPIVVSGELIDESAAACLGYYGIDRVCVVK